MDEAPFEDDHENRSEGVWYDRGECPNRPEEGRGCSWPSHFTPHPETNVGFEKPGIGNPATCRDAAWWLVRCVHFEALREYRVEFSRSPGTKAGLRIKVRFGPIVGTINTNHTL